MDRMIYVAMNGAKHTLERQAAVSHNLANASTAGFRAAVSAFRALPVVGPGAGTRTFVVDTTTAGDFRPGPVTQTGRALDVAVMGDGWIAVQGPDGREAYTRAGDLQLTSNGQLQTRDGLNVLGEAGPITIPPNAEVTIGSDGTVSAVPLDGIPNAVDILGRIKLVNPPAKDLQRSDDGLFRLAGATPAPADANVQLASGTLEGSNVSVVESLVEMISHARQYETQIKLIQMAENNARQWSQIMNMSA
ncbi:MAG: flagellar basal-body rod protein FlgF [Burkholderiales bacterium]|nr:flagellar basal-body rod protein FlgF [Burkholderiales bacterium]MCW5621818.1 flagellar basal-body rod protein FlgF [Burkholderiales bacterium]